MSETLCDTALGAVIGFCAALAAVALAVEGVYLLEWFW